MCSQFMFFFPSYFYIIVSNWLMESVDQLFFVSLWNVHIVQLHTESRAVHNKQSEAYYFSCASESVTNVA